MPHGAAHIEELTSCSLELDWLEAPHLHVGVTGKGSTSLGAPVAPKTWSPSQPPPPLDLPTPASPASYWSPAVPSVASAPLPPTPTTSSRWLQLQAQARCSPSTPSPPTQQRPSSSGHAAWSPASPSGRAALQQRSPLRSFFQAEEVAPFGADREWADEDREERAGTDGTGGLLRLRPHKSSSRARLSRSGMEADVSGGSMMVQLPGSPRAPPLQQHSQRSLQLEGRSGSPLGARVSGESGLAGGGSPRGANGLGVSPRVPTGLRRESLGRAAAAAAAAGQQGQPGPAAAPWDCHSNSSLKRVMTPSDVQLESCNSSQRTLSFAARNPEAGLGYSDDSLSETELEVLTLPGDADGSNHANGHTSRPRNLTLGAGPSLTSPLSSRSKSAWETERFLHMSPDLNPTANASSAAPASVTAGMRTTTADPEAAEQQQQQRQQQRLQSVSQWEAELQRAVAAAALCEAVQRPAPSSGLVRCRVRRVTTFFGASVSFQVHLEGQQQLMLLAARKRKKSLTTSYVVSQDLQGLKRGADTCIAKLKANADESEYQLWGRTANKHVNKGYAGEELLVRFTKPAEAAAAAAAKGGGAAASGASGGSPTMLAIVPLPQGEGQGKGGRPAQRPEKLGNLLELAQSGDLPSFLANKVAVFSSQCPSQKTAGSRVQHESSSAKNCALYVNNLSEGRNDAAAPRPASLDSSSSPAQGGLALQFSKLGEDCFALSFGYPLSVMSAFAVALSRMRLPDE